MEPTRQITIRLKETLIQHLEKSSKERGFKNIQAMIYYVLDQWNENSLDHPIFKDINPEVLSKLFGEIEDMIRIYDADSATMKPIDKISMEDQRVILKSKRIA